MVISEIKFECDVSTSERLKLTTDVWLDVRCPVRRDGDFGPAELVIDAPLMWALRGDARLSEPVDIDVSDVRSILRVPRGEKAPEVTLTLKGPDGEHVIREFEIKPGPYSAWA